MSEDRKESKRESGSRKNDGLSRRNFVLGTTGIVGGLLATANARMASAGIGFPNFLKKSHRKKKPGGERKAAAVREELLERIKKIPVIDTHEHMTTEAKFIEGRWDFTHLDYIDLDLQSAGCRLGRGRAMRFREDLSDGEKWQQISPFWPFVKNGAYARGYRRLLRIFFDTDDLDERTVREVSKRIAEYQHEGVYDEYIHDRYGIRVMLMVHDHTPVAEPQHFAPIFEVDNLAGALSADVARQALGGVLPRDFGDFRGKVQERVEEAAGNGAVGLKIGMTARRRPLDFVAHSTKEVQNSYDFLRKQADGDERNKETIGRLKPLQDATFWAIFEKAGELGLPIQVHSGLEFPQPWDGRPSALIPSLMRFPDTKFAIFHGSYPYMDELTGLAKSFPNVYLDLAWFHLLSRYQARTWMAEWLDVVPHNKIFAFGGDLFIFFGICSHLEIARENVADVLAERLEDGLCDVDEAEQTARLLFHDNAWNTFKFENWRERSPMSEA